MDKLEAVRSRGVDLQREWIESPDHPQNWPDRRRWTIALVIALTGFLVRSRLEIDLESTSIVFDLSDLGPALQSTLDSSIFVPDLATLQKRYHVSRDLATLTVSLYVVGLGCGPFVFAPISELYGRQRAYVISMIGTSSACRATFRARSADAALNERLHVHESGLLLCGQVRSASAVTALRHWKFDVAKMLTRFRHAIQPRRICCTTFVGT